MRRRKEPPRETYRESATRSSRALPLTVTCVRPGEYADQEWVQGLRERLRRILLRLRGD